MKLTSLQEAARSTTFIAISDMDLFRDWDERFGHGGTDQLDYDDGIVVKNEDAEYFKKQVAKFEKYAAK